MSRYNHKIQKWMRDNEIRSWRSTDDEKERKFCLAVARAWFDMPKEVYIEVAHQSFRTAKPAFVVFVESLRRVSEKRQQLGAPPRSGRVLP